MKQGVKWKARNRVFSWLISFSRLWINTLALSKSGISKEAALQQKSLESRNYSWLPQSLGVCFTPKETGTRDKLPPENKHDIGKCPFLIGHTYSTSSKWSIFHSHVNFLGCNPFSHMSFKWVA